MKLLRIFLLAIFVATSSYSRANLSIVRDAEVEEFLLELVKPIFKAAGLQSKSAKVYVINSDSINAFTIGNGYIFINLGLLLKFENPLHLLGILCHETAHVAAGHIERQIAVMQRSSNNCTWAMLAGILGAIFTGSAAAMAVPMGYAMADERFFLRFTRGEEFSADALAVTYLEKLGYGSDVLIEAFDVFQRLDLLNGGVNLPVYVLSHPKTSDRISAIQKRAKGKKFRAGDEMLQKYKRVLIKLKAYLKDFDVRTITPEDDYSRAVYFHRIGRSVEAIELLRKLSEKNPQDIYQKEALAQTLYEAGQLEESIKIYEEIYNDNINVLVKIDYANVLIEANKKNDLAISILESAKYTEYFNSDIFRLLAKGYGKQKREGLSALMLAQEQMLQGNYDTALHLLLISIDKLDPKTEQSHIKKAKYLKELIKRKNL
ncbi:MAG: M48 family metalloprotease [Holosporaceae bacterium]|jgi:predicted Zn-dependent protease|nr:M48 family metalloprotease [Holosporaceae bacterium]